MTQVRVPLVTGAGGIQAAVPTFVEIPRTYQAADPTVISANGVLAGIPLGDARLASVTVLVDVPPDEVDGNGGLNKARIKQKYPEHFLTKQGRFD